jgi:hypothetical protein
MTSSGSAVNHFGAVDETTKRLVGRCAQVPWLKEEMEDNKVTNQKGLLGIEIPSAMTSALSVVEFASAHKDSPSMQTSDEGVGLRKNGTQADERIGKEKAIGQEKSPFEVDVEGEGEGEGEGEA